MVCNDLPDDVHSASFLSSFRNNLKNYLFAKVDVFSTAWNPTMSVVN